MKILGISGSLREGSHSLRALDLALAKARRLGCETEKIDLKDLKLPMCNGGADYPSFPDVQTIRQKMKETHGIILSSPEYHGSISGALKNMLDLLDFEHVEGKVFALICVLGGDYSTNAINAIRTICRHLHAWVVPEQIVIPNVNEAFDGEGNLREPELNERLDSMIAHFVKYTRKLHD